jgi:D-alanyl-D-alanine carboxypeptidase (penicillin-binding protein 5/6)
VTAFCVALIASSATAARAAPPRAEARAWLVQNPATGQVLDAYAPRARMPIASITKLMTVIVALSHLRLDQIIEVDPRAAAVGQESVYLTPYEQISVRDLVKAALIQSANDAADALALATAPSFPAFAALMNAKARALGLDDTHFVRPDGLDAPGEYSSAHDVDLLAQAAMRDPVVASTVRLRSAVISGGRVLHTWNDLLGTFPGVFGVKTGNTSGAGWCEVAAARADGTTIYATILGSPSRVQRNDDLERLLAYGLAQYREVDLVAARQAYADVNLPYGRGRLTLVASARLEQATRLGSSLTERVLAPLSVSLPVHAGEVIGAVRVYASGRLLGERALVASRSVTAPGLVGRIGWYSRRSVHDLVRLLT